MNTDYEAATGLKERLSLSVFTSGRRRLEASQWRHPDVLGTFWRFYRNDHDGAFLTMSGVPYPFQAGTLYLIPPGLHFHCDNTGPLDHFYIHFDVPGLSGLAMREIFDAPLELSPTPDLAAVVAALASAPLPDRTDAAEALSWQCGVQLVLYSVFRSHLQHLSPEQVERGRRRSAALGPVLPAVRYIEQDLSARISNACLAALCHMNEDYFIQRFRECVGASPASYVQERRVLSAAQCLLFSGQTIDAIAESVGFGSRHHLSRVFKQRMGTSPAAYRARGSCV